MPIVVFDLAEGRMEFVLEKLAGECVEIVTPITEAPEDGILDSWTPTAIRWHFSSPATCRLVKCIAKTDTTTAISVAVPV